MANGDLSTDLSLSLLTPASSVRATGGDSTRHEAEARARRQARDAEKDRDDNPLENDDGPEHQLDSLA